METITQAHSLRPLLLECTLKKMREHIVSLISHTMSILLKYEERSLFENDQKEYADDDDEDDDSESSRMKLTRVRWCFGCLLGGVSGWCSGLLVGGVSS